MRIKLFWFGRVDRGCAPKLSKICFLASRQDTNEAKRSDLIPPVVAVGSFGTIVIEYFTGGFADYPSKMEKAMQENRRFSAQKGNRKNLVFLCRWEKYPIVQLPFLVQENQRFSVQK